MFRQMDQFMKIPLGGNFKTPSNGPPGGSSLEFCLFLQNVYPVSISKGMATKRDSRCGIEY